MAPSDAADGRPMHDDLPTRRVDLDDLFDWNRDPAPSNEPAPDDEEVRSVAARAVAEIGHDADPAAGIEGGEANTAREAVVPLVDHGLFSAPGAGHLNVCVPTLPVHGRCSPGGSIGGSGPAVASAAQVPESDRGSAPGEAPAADPASAAAARSRSGCQSCRSSRLDPGRLRDLLDHFARLLRLHLVGNVGLRNDIDQAIFLDHRQSTHLMARHERQRLVEFLLWVDRHKAARRGLRR